MAGRESYWSSVGAGMILVVMTATACGGWEHPYVASPTAPPTATPTPPVAPPSGQFFVSDPAYGSSAGGFYWDTASHLIWTAERGWHAFDPAAPASGMLWVNVPGYGNAGGFYLDAPSGTVWTVARGWHSYGPSATVQIQSVTPTPAIRTVVVPPTATPTTPTATRVPPTATPTNGGGGCNPNYEGYCFDQPGDYDCFGGKGNGPHYVPVRVRVIGPDDYALDDDDDGFGCDRLPEG